MERYNQDAWFTVLHNPFAWEKPPEVGIIQDLTSKNADFLGDTGKTKQEWYGSILKNTPKSQGFLAAYETLQRGAPSGWACRPMQL